MVFGCVTIYIKVAGSLWKSDDSVFEGARNFNLTAKPRSLGQTVSQVKHVILLWGRCRQFFEDFLCAKGGYYTWKDDVAGGACQGGLARAFEIDAILVCYFKEALPDFSVDLFHRVVLVAKDQLDGAEATNWD
jgi:hypothetical protein